MAAIQLMKKKELLIDLAVATLVGFIFGLGLAISGMVKRSKIIGFLAINDKWDRNKSILYLSHLNICDGHTSGYKFFRI